jgi:glycosyltransferase involved in cell wall biosynthesis
MRPERVLFILSRVLGGKTFSAYVQRAAEGLCSEPEFAFLEEADYGTYGPRLPVWQRAAGLFLGAGIMKRKLRERPPRPCDAIFLQSFEILPALSGFDARLPVILAHDSTNVLSYRLIRQAEGTPAAAFACLAKSLLVTPAYRAYVRRVRAFLPRTHWCAASLVGDFGVHPGRILVAPAGLDLESWKPAPPRPPRDRPLLLFVGNDFARKGGPFLLDLFADRLAGKARLRIVSNDPALQGRAFPPGVECLSGLGPGDPGALLEAFRTADIFVFPTRKEHLGLAAVEACAAGLPIVAADVGGVGEAVRPGENGFLIPYGAGREAWAAALEMLIGNPALRARMGAASRSLAEREFGSATLRRRLEEAFALAAEGTGFPHRFEFRSTARK